MKKIWITSLFLSLQACEYVEVAGNTKSSSPKKDMIETVAAGLGGVLDDLWQEGSHDFLTSCSREAVCTAPNMARTVNCQQTAENTQFIGFHKLVMTVNPVSSTEPGVPDCVWDKGETVAHTANTTLKSPSVGRITRTTFNLPTYEGNVVGGGTDVTRLSDTSAVLTIRGTHRRNILLDGEVNYETSFSSGDINITGAGKRTERKLSTPENSTLTVYHNTHSSKASLTLNKLNWNDASCCFPTSGSITATFSGNLSGTEVFTFSGCGIVTSSTESFTLVGCE